MSSPAAVACTWPADDLGALCGRPAAVIYTKGRRAYPRCRRHDTRAAQAEAERGRYQRAMVAL